MSKEKPDKLNKFLVALRNKNGFTQAFLAEQLNMSRSTYAYYETGKTEPSFTTLGILAKIYNISVDCFLEVENSTTLSDSKKKFQTFKTITIVESLNQSEKELIALYRLANPTQKRKVMNVLEPKKVKNEEN